MPDPDISSIFTAPTWGLFLLDIVSQSNATAWGYLFITLILVLLNGYFVAQEFAFVAVKRPRIEALVKEGDKQAKSIEQVLSQLSFMLSGAQFGITITALVVGFIANDAIGVLIAPLFMQMGVREDVASGISLTIAFILVTVVQMVFSELAPKNWAIAEPERLSRIIAPSTLVYLKVAHPIIRMFDSSANKLLHWVGIEPVEELNEGSSAEELEYIVSSSSDSGELDENLSTLFNRAIAFGELNAGQVCVGANQLVSLRLNDTLTRLQELVAATGHSRYPVLDPVTRRPIGVTDVKSLLSIPRSEWANTPIGQVMHSIPMLPDTVPLGLVLQQLRTHRSHAAFVIDEHGDLEGMLTLEDLLEELIGEIRDEHDAEETPPFELMREEYRDPSTKHPTTVWVFQGWARVDEFERETTIDVPEGDYNTVAGWFIANNGKLGSAGDIVVVEDLRKAHNLNPITVTMQALTATAYTTDTIMVTVEEHGHSEVTS